MISCLFDLTELESYKSIRVLLVWIVDTLSPRERLCTLAAGLSSQGTVTVDAIVEAAATPLTMSKLTVPKQNRLGHF